MAKVSLKELRVKKKSKKVERFMPEKIKKALLASGGQVREAAQTTRDVVNYILHNSKSPVVTFKNIGKEIFRELKDKNKKLADHFKDYMNSKNVCA
ncbi:MAG: hypothetical protein KKA79_02710 [Nanoarchaeota archaeon]|nr:hypothetical protein [Nanoarchaeota archaeon]